MLISGQCQCGNIAFTLHWPQEAGSTPIAARACTCAFCVTHSGIWTSNPSARLEVRIGNAALVTRHSFATKTAAFHICNQCKDVPLVTSEIDGRLFAAVNVNAFQDLPPATVRCQPASFDGESVAQRLERRRQRWIAEVTFTEPPH